MKSKARDDEIHGTGQSPEEGRMLSRRTLIKIGWTVPVVAMALPPTSVLMAASVSPDPESVDPCNYSYGYWMACPAKNFPNTVHEWPVTEVEVGGNTYSKLDALVIMRTQSKTDQRIVMFRQLVAAKLNWEVNDGLKLDPAYTQYKELIDAADKWMAQYPLGTVNPTTLKLSSTYWNPSTWDAAAQAMHTQLDAFNSQLYHCE